MVVRWGSWSVLKDAGRLLSGRGCTGLGVGGPGTGFYLNVGCRLGGVIHG